MTILIIKDIIVRGKSTWQINEAKSRFSNLIQHAENDGPQTITKHGVESVVVVSVELYRKLKAAQPDFKEYLLSGPKVDDFEIDRPRDSGRGIDL